MVVIYTGKHQIDKILENEIKESIAISYLEFIIENEKFKNQIAILAAQEIGIEEFESYLYKLRELNIRIILLFTGEKEEKEKIKIALRLGVYDFIFGNFYPSQIKDLIYKPRTFKDIAKLYKKTFDLKVKKRKKLKQEVKYK